MDAFDFEKTVRESLAGGLKGDKETWAAHAAACVKQVLLSQAAASSFAADAKSAVILASLGAMKSVLLAEGDLPAAAVALLRELVEVANQKTLDPAEALRWGMGGIAQAALMAAAGTKEAVSSKIDQEFTDMGLIFDEIVLKFAASQRR